MDLKKPVFIDSQDYFQQLLDGPCLTTQNVLTSHSQIMAMRSLTIVDQEDN